MIKSFLWYRKEAALYGPQSELLLETEVIDSTLSSRVGQLDGAVELPASLDGVVVVDPEVLRAVFLLQVGSRTKRPELPVLTTEEVGSVERAVRVTENLEHSTFGFEDVNVVTNVRLAGLRTVVVNLTTN